MRGWVIISLVLEVWGGEWHRMLFDKVEFGGGWVLVEILLDFGTGVEIIRGVCFVVGVGSWVGLEVVWVVCGGWWELICFRVEFGLGMGEHFVHLLLLFQGAFTSVLAVGGAGNGIFFF
jgi:hypothetical protein